MSLIQSLKESPESLPPSSKFTVFNGVFYMAVGALLLVWPGAVQVLMFAPDYVGQEAALMRILGMTVAILGWFYYFGGRAGAKQIVAASVLDRIILVPVVLVPLALAGVFPVLLFTFAIVDPALGLIAWFLLAKENRERRNEPAPESQPHDDA